MLLLIGTSYLNNKNKQKTEEMCEFCNRTNSLLEYDTFKWGTLFYIPIIPLGKKHISKHCQHCEMLYEIPLNKWQESKKGNLKRAKENYTLNNINPDTALELFKHYEDFNNFTAANKLALDLENDFPDNLEIILYIAYWHYKNNNYLKAFELYEKTHKIEPDNQFISSMLACLYLKLEKYDESKNIYLNLQSFRSIDDYLNMLKLATLLRNNNQTKDAYEVLKFIIKNFNGHAIKDQLFIEEVKQTEKTIHVQKSILPAHVLVNRTKIFATAIVILATLLAAYSNYYLKQNQTLYIVNHIVRETELRLNSNKIIKLNPGELKEIKIPENDYKAEIRISKLNPSKINFSTKNTLISRYLDNNTFVLNINGSAVIIREAIIYGDKPSQKNTESSYSFFTGKDFYRFSSIDYPFIEPPRSILLDESVKSKVKISLRLLNTDPYDSAKKLFKYKNLIKPEQVLKYMESHLKSGYRPDFFIKLYKSKSRELKLSTQANKFLSNL